MRWEVKPSQTRWTDEQWQAISMQGNNLLVAAAAGSGKTAVLVERLIRRISNDDGVDVDRLLVATFTKAAADEMRQRVREALEKQLQEQPASAHIKRQLALIHRASITTLHSFCLDVVRRYYQMIPIDPSFRIGNDIEMALLRQDALEDMFEHYYATSDDDSVFWQLVDSYSGERSDDALFQLVLTLYDFSRSHPWPDLWLTQMAHSFSQKDQHHVWFDSLLEDVKLVLAGAIDQLNEAIELAYKPNGPDAYIDTLNEDLAMVQQIYDVAQHGEWDQVYDAFQQVIFNRLKAARGEDLDKSLQEAVKGLRDEVKKQLVAVQESYFHRTSEQYSEEMQEIAPLMELLVELVKAFHTQYRELKAAKGLLDFNDLEHYCLRILCDPDAPPGELRPSHAALEYQQQFVEVMLDEYQDTNQVQEAIVSLLSRSAPGNRFMVGDVKQSIYRFRLAEPALFLEKYERFMPVADVMSTLVNNEEQPNRPINADDVSPPSGVVIDLAHNFRSNRQVVHGVNYIFKQIMQRSIGEIDYDDQAKLKFAATYMETEDTLLEGEVNDRSIEVCLIDKTGALSEDEHGEAVHRDGGKLADEDETSFVTELETVQLEARLIAAKIKEMMGGEARQQMHVIDSTTNTLRPVTYRDMVILLRATKQWAPVMLEELKQAGIPCYAELSTGYFEAGEVEIVLSLLQIIDNPMQDIPLTAVLRSPIYQLSAEELAQIRILKKGAPFYEAVWHYANAQHVYNVELQLKLQRFIRELEGWREEVRFGSLSALIWQLYQDTGYYDMVGGMAGGMQRQANLRALYDRAKQYEATSFRGLFRFLRFIERMRQSGEDLGTARALGEQENVVRIVSIHRSKGLEYPVVFVAGLARRFNRQDLNGNFLIHKSLGFGPKFIDTVERVSYPTIANLAIKRKLHMEMLAEEMRVLYVALTRAKEKLILIGTSRHLDKDLQQWQAMLGKSTWLLPEHIIVQANCFMDWIGPALIRHPDSQLWRRNSGVSVADDQLLVDASQWTCSIHSASEFAAPYEVSERLIEEDREKMEQALAYTKPVAVSPSVWQREIKERLAWSYPYRKAATYFSKTSVSEMKRLASMDAIRQSVEDEAVYQMFTDVDELVMMGDGKHGITDDSGQSQIDEAAAARMADQPSLGSVAFHKPLLRRPRFLEARQMTAAERGTLYHAVMQYIPLTSPINQELIERCMAEMVALQFITEEQSKQIDPAILEVFFSSPLGHRLLNAQDVQREIPFSFAMKVSEVYPQADEQTAEEKVLIQGVIDCLFEDEQGLVLLDYKTDAVYGNQLKRIRERYQLQVDLYAKAVEQIRGQKVTAKILFLFDGGHILTM